MNNKNINILVVDDELSLRSIVAEVLTDAGYVVEIASNGQEAIDHVKKNNPHIVITDIRMPELSGMELLEKIKAHNQDIEVIIMTSNASIDSAIQALRLGAYDYLTKPFEDLNLIPRAVERTVEKLRLRTEVDNLVNELRRKNQHIQDLYSYTAKLFSTLQRGEVINLSLEAIEQMTPATHTAFLEYDSYKNTLTLQHWLGAPASTQTSLDDYDNHQTLNIRLENLDVDSEAFFRKIDAQTTLKQQVIEALHKVEAPVQDNVLLVPLFSATEFVGTYVLSFANSEDTLDEEQHRLLEQYLRNVVTHAEKAVLHQQVQELAIRDGLTNLFNHRYFQNAMAQEIERCRRYDKSFSIILFDIDHFKHYNDTNGHPMGDQVVRGVGQITADTGRRTDIQARYGGEEFILLLVETERAGAAVRAENLRKAVAEHTFANQEKQPLGNLTISGGYAEYPTDGKSGEELVQAADQALYTAKKKGRNCMVAAKPLKE